MLISRSIRSLLTRSKRANFSAAPLSAFSELQPTENVLKLADNLCGLNLMETTQLKRLNINPMMAAFAAAPANASAANAAAPAEAPKVVEKTEFKLTLQKFETAAKAKIIREIKLILPQLNLVEAKNFVEGAPKLIKEKLKKEEAEKIKKTLEELGATITMD